MEEVPRDGDKVACMRQVNLPVVEIKPMIGVAKELIVIDPDVVGFLHRDGIVALDFVDYQVADDDV